MIDPPRAAVMSTRDLRYSSAWARTPGSSDAGSNMGVAATLVVRVVGEDGHVEPLVTEVLQLPHVPDEDLRVLRVARLQVGGEHEEAEVNVPRGAHRVTTRGLRAGTSWP